MDVSNGRWRKEKFIGYPLIEAYTSEELERKISAIKELLSFHWIEAKEVHGDFTHFNILIDSDRNFHFIDQKQTPNPKLFDLFYFYAYLRQCLERCTTLSSAKTKKLIQSLEQVISEVVGVTGKSKVMEELSRIKLPDEHGIRKENIDAYQSDFALIFQ